MKMKMKNLLVIALLAGSFNASADVVFGVFGGGPLGESDGYTPLWSGGRTSENYAQHSSSSAGWSISNRFFAADGKYYVISGGNQLYSFNSAQDLWSFQNGTTYGTSAVGWNKTHQFMAHEGRYFAINQNYDIYEASSALNLWAGNYTHGQRRLVNGWGAQNSYFYNGDGVHALSNNSGLYHFTTVDAFMSGDLSQRAEIGFSSTGWSRFNQFFSDGQVGISLDFSSNLASDVSAPVLGGLLMSGLLLLGGRKNNSTKRIKL